MKTYSYRYIWKTLNDEETELHLSIITATEAQHEDHIKALADDASVISALREYICTYEVDNMAKIDTIKKEQENETIFS